MVAQHDLARGEQEQVRVDRLQGSLLTPDTDSVAREEPLQLLIDAVPLAILLRTPGEDLELAIGLLHAEGIVRHHDDIAYVRLAPSGQRRLGPGPIDVRLDPQAENLVDVHLRQPLPGGGVGWQRALPATSACGICGAATMEALELVQRPVLGTRIWALERLLALPAMLAASQRVFSATGGLHAAGLVRWEGPGMEVAEDVGRHNAVDKLVGRAFLAATLPLHDACILVSGRAGFEIVQKAAAAQVAVLASISAPSSLAVRAAEVTGVTLVGFLRGEHANVYTHPERLDGGRATGVADLTQ